MKKRPVVGLRAVQCRAGAVWQVPWTLHNHADHAAQNRPRRSADFLSQAGPGKLTFDRLSSVFLSNTSHHEEDRPSCS